MIVLLWYSPKGGFFTCPPQAIWNKAIAEPQMELSKNAKTPSVGHSWHCLVYLSKTLQRYILYFKNPKYTFSFLTFF
jgi:hypothetical protein